MARKRKPKTAAVVPPIPAPGTFNAPPERFRGRLASDISMSEVTWILSPWIPRRMLTMVVGQPAIGKSTLLSTLMAHVTNWCGFGDQDGMAENVVLLPGSEESFAVATAPRLKAADVDLKKVLVLDREHYSLMSDREALTKRIKQHKAALVVIDPIDSYMDEGLSEDRGQDVRPFLESVTRLAEETNAAVVCTRHPGKDPENILPGSRAWRAIPRVVIQLASDGSYPPQYTMSAFKYSLGPKPKARRYTLDGEDNGFRQFKLTDEVDHMQQDMEKNTNGPTGRYNLDRAMSLIRWFFSTEDKPTRSGLDKIAEKESLGKDTVSEALFRLGIKSVPPYERGLPWNLIRIKEEWPEWLKDPTPPKRVGEDLTSQNGPDGPGDGE